MAIKKTELDRSKRNILAKLYSRKNKTSKPKITKAMSAEKKFSNITLSESENSRFKRLREQEFEYVSDKDITKDILTTVDLVNAVSIVYSLPNHPILIDNRYTRFLQILEIEGKDLSSLSDSEQMLVINSFTSFLTQYPYSMTFESTTLPTNTAIQYGDSNRIYKEYLLTLADPSLPKVKYNQIRERLLLLKNNMDMQEKVSQQLYNEELLVFIFADSPRELEKYVKTCLSASNKIIQVRIVKDNKKKQIIKQLNNPSERV